MSALALRFAWRELRGGPRGFGVFVACIVLGGKAADLLGARLVSMAGLALFGVASCIIALASDEAALLAGRALQGFSAAFAVPSTLAAVGTTSDSHIFPTIVNALVHTKFKPVPGYSGGTGQINIAVERGEVMGRGGTSWASVQSANKAWLDGNKLNFFCMG